MQVISGIYKNRKIESPNSELTHPMGSREKMALFNMLQPYLEGASVLDVFAGSGALGIEALSRGARSVVFVEKSAKIAKVIKANLKAVVEEANATVVTSDIKNFEPNQTFDLIIADPPYNLYDPALIEPLLNYLNAGGILALSHPKGSAVPTFANASPFKTHAYSGAEISIFEKL
ncbi:16S rRNA (guanine(966)-N(2))-methyltransferase RsmD [Candidatus Saccharibacteria bacterium]|nr:16S rRNA (guanine(966)-N(2))-methyltransferase RsmD [Candidatus Saccharibacteria bacterium]